MFAHMLVLCVCVVVRVCVVVWAAGNSVRVWCDLLMVHSPDVFPHFQTFSAKS